MADINNYFATNLKYLRLCNNMNQEQLGKALNKDYSTIGKWENGSRSPNMQDTLDICEYFNVDLNDLITINMKMVENVELDETHKVDKIIMDNLKTLTEEDKKKIITIMELVKKDS